MLLAPTSSRFYPFRLLAVGPLASGLLLAGCGRAPAAGSALAGAPVADAGFLPPPAPITADRTSGGGVRLAGRAPSSAEVKLASPTGESLQATAGSEGGWAVEFGPAAAPRLYALSAAASGRTLRGEGALAVLPPESASAALLLRSGAAAWPAQASSAPSDPAARPPPRLASVDFDAGGGFAASGWARPGAVVQLMLDGAVAGQGQADAKGRFAVLATAAPATAAVHAVDVRTAEGIDARVVVLASAAALAQPFRAARVSGGWRIDWAAPAGAVQSVVAFDALPVFAPRASEGGAGAGQ